MFAVVCCADSCPVYPAKGAALPSGGMGWGDHQVLVWSSAWLTRLEIKLRRLYEDNVVIQSRPNTIFY